MLRRKPCKYASHERERRRERRAIAQAVLGQTEETWRPAGDPRIRERITGGIKRGSPSPPPVGVARNRRVAMHRAAYRTNVAGWLTPWRTLIALGAHLAREPMR